MVHSLTSNGTRHGRRAVWSSLRQLLSMHLSAGGGWVDGLDAADEVGRGHVVLVARPLELTCGQILFLL